VNIATSSRRLHKLTDASRKRQKGWGASLLAPPKEKEVADVASTTIWQLVFGTFLAWSVRALQYGSGSTLEC